MPGRRSRTISSPPATSISTAPPGSVQAAALSNRLASTRSSWAGMSSTTVGARRVVMRTAGHRRSVRPRPRSPARPGGLPTAVRASTQCRPGRRGHRPGRSGRPAHGGRRCAHRPARPEPDLAQEVDVGAQSTSHQPPGGRLRPHRRRPGRPHPRRAGLRAGAGCGFHRPHAGPRIGRAPTHLRHRRRPRRQRPPARRLRMVRGRLRHRRGPRATPIDNTQPPRRARDRRRATATIAPTSSR